MAVGLMWSFSLIWISLFGLYVLVPNARVSWKPALAGAFVAAILVQVGKTELRYQLAGTEVQLMSMHVTVDNTDDK